MSSRRTRVAPATVSYKKLNKRNILGQHPVPRVDVVLDKLDTGRIFSLFDLVSSIHKITAHKYTIPLTAFCARTRLLEWLLIQGSSLRSSPTSSRASTASLPTSTTSTSSTLTLLHVANMKEFFLRLRKHNLKLPPSKATIGATDADFLGHTISPAGIMPKAQKEETLTKMTMPEDLKQLRYLLVGLFLLQEISARCGDADTAHHLPS